MKKEIFIVAVFFTFISSILFRHWIFDGLAPIAADLQVNFYQPWKSDNIPSKYKPLGFDDIRIFYPQRIFSIEQLLAGKLPLWNPYEFSGNVHLANSQTATFYPLTLLYFFLSPIFVWSFSSFILPIMAGVFTYLFLRIHLGKLPALFGAVAFALSGVMIVRLEDGIIPGHAAVWLPLALYGVDKKKFLWTIIALSFSILAGWFQFSFYVLASTILYLLFRRQSIKVIITVLFLVLTITAVHWLPAMQALKFSPRGDASSVDLQTHLMPISHLITLLSPNFFGHPTDNTYFGKSEYKEAMIYVGLLPLALALLAIKKFRSNKTILFFSTVVFLTIPFGLNFPGIAFFLSKIPIVSSFLPNRIFFLSSFSLCILSAFGWEYFSNKSFRKILIFLAAILLLILLAILSIYINDKLLLSTTHYSFFQRGIERYLLIMLLAIRESFILIIAAGLALILHIRSKITSKFFLVTILTISIVGQLLFADHYLYFSNKNNLFPSHPVIDFLQKNTTADFSRFATIGDAKFTSNTASYYHLYDTEGVDALYPTWYGEFMGFVQSKGQSIVAQDRISTWFAPAITSTSNWQSPYVVNFLRIAGVRYVVTKNPFPLPPKSLFQTAFRYKDWTIFEYLNPLPKATFVSSYEVVPDKKTMLEKIFDPNFDPAKMVLLFTPPSNKPDTKAIGTIGTVQVLSYQPQEVKLKSSSSGPGFIFLNDNYFPNWHAQIDGKESSVLQADYTFRAVPVSTGEHNIVLKYHYF